MNFHPTHLRWLPLAVGAALVLVFSAGAQQGGEPIIFSSPDGGTLSSNLTHLTKPLDLPDPFQAGLSGLGPDLPSGGAPAGMAIPSAVSINEGQQLQSLLHPKKDWATMTPDEIMGVASPDQNTQTPDRSPVNFRDNPAWDQHFPGKSDFQTDMPNSVSIPSSLSQLFNNTPQRGDNFSSPNAVVNSWNPSGGSSVFSTSDSSQPTEMDQFKQLLGANPPVSTGTRSYSSSGSSFFPPQSSGNNNFSQPVANPIGASYTPLTSGIGTPMGLPSLPTLNGQSSLQPAISPAWTPQAPPWMSQGPQPFVIPQRQF